MKKVFLLFIPIIFIECATVSFYKEKDLKKETGLKFYYPKPYLLVEKNPQPTKSSKIELKIKSTIIYLPDLENATYAKIKPGIGKSDLQIRLENGILTSYGFISDTKTPETIKAVADLVSAASKIVSATKPQYKEGNIVKPQWALYEIVMSEGKTKLIKVEIGE